MENNSNNYLFPVDFKSKDIFSREIKYPDEKISGPVDQVHAEFNWGSHRSCRL